MEAVTNVTIEVSGRLNSAAVVEMLLAVEIDDRIAA